MRFILCLAFLLLLAPAASAAQQPPAVITGRVMVLDSVQASAGVYVRIESANVRVQTDSSGWYRLVVPASRITGDSVYLAPERIGIRHGSRRILLAPGSEIRVDFDMKVDRLEQLPHCAHLVHAVPRPVDESVKLCDLSRRVERWVAERGAHAGPSE